jgi:LEA14-like dessication related protein
MRHRIISLIAIALISILPTGCDVMKQVGGAYNMSQCKYEYRSISNLNISGMDLSKGISLTHIPKITAILSGSTKSIPLSFTLNVDINNPNASAAMLQGLQYMLSIDNVDFTTGSVDNALNVPAGGTQVMPLAIGFDLATLLKGESKDAVVNIVKNFLGIGDKASNVTFRIKPTFMIGSVPVTAPAFIPVTFSFGGKK